MEKRQSSLSPDNQPNKFTINRRDFIKSVGTSLCLLAIPSDRFSSENIKPVAKVVDQQRTPIRSLRTIQTNPLEQIRKKQPGLIHTVAEQTLLHFGKVLTRQVLQKVNIKTGNANTEKGDYAEKYRREPIKTASLSWLIVPILEELGLRYNPQEIFIKKSDRRLRWDIGIPVSAVFALMHNIYLGEGKELHIATDTVPLTQFMGGIFYWYLIRERGIEHSILAHSLNNASADICELLLKKFPKQDS